MSTQAKIDTTKKDCLLNDSGYTKISRVHFARARNRLVLGGALGPPANSVGRWWWWWCLIDSFGVCHGLGGARAASSTATGTLAYWAWPGFGTGLLGPACLSNVAAKVMHAAGYNSHIMLSW
jgi:hypothetical protein